MAIPTFVQAEISNKDSYFKTEYLTKKAFSLDSSLLHTNTSWYRLVSSTLFYRGSISQADATSVFKKYYETGPDCEKPHYCRSRKEHEDPLPAEFNKGFPALPSYFSDWVPKGRNFKICDKPADSGTSAWAVSISSEIYYFLESLNHSFDLLFSKRYNMRAFNFNFIFICILWPSS